MSYSAAGVQVESKRHLKRGLRRARVWQRDLRKFLTDAKKGQKSVRNRSRIGHKSDEKLRRAEIGQKDAPAIKSDKKLKPETYTFAALIFTFFISVSLLQGPLSKIKL